MEENRKLAHVEIIKELKEIPGADKIEVAQVLGWECVVKKGEFNIGDKIIYIEVDSIMPHKPEYEFLETRKYRVKTIKLKGQVSQGLVIPIPNDWKYMSDHRHTIGADVTEILQITKYLSSSEKEEMSQIKREFPYWVSKTDEPRCISGSSILNTDRGDFTIEEICESKETFKVKSYNTSTDTVEYKEIIGKSIKSNNNDWYEIELEDSTKVILTSEHPVYLPKLNCYRQVKDLKSDDLVLMN